jgi:hypothetical protein
VQLDKSSFDATLSYNNCDDAIAPVFPEEYNVFCAYSDDSTGDKPTMPQADELDHEAFDEYLDAQVVLLYKDIATTGTVIARKKDCNGNVVGKSHPNPVLDTRVMEVQFPDGNVQKFAANVIAEHLYSQVDDEGRRFRIVDEIIDHKMDGSAAAPDDMYYTDKHGVKRIRQTTKGWVLLLQWKDGSTTWFPLKDLKESNPIEVAKYAIANKLLHEPVIRFYLLTSVFVEYDERVEVGGKAS